MKIVVGQGSCGIAAGARPVLNAFARADDRRLHRHVLSRADCRYL